MTNLFYSEEQYREYQDELMYSPREAYYAEMAAIAQAELAGLNDDEPWLDAGPQERTATWVEEGGVIYVQHPSGSCADISRAAYGRQLPKVTILAADVADDCPF